MTKISDAIGGRFEKHFMDTFSGFRDCRNGKDNKKLPDFYNPEYGFWVETKAGNSTWGCRLHEYQIQDFQNISEPVVYCFGLHNFNKANKRLSGKTSRGIRRILKNQMDFVELYWVTQQVVEKIWEKENRVSDRGEVYCMAKGHIFRDILLDRRCRRFGEVIESPRDYYGVHQNEFLLQTLEKNQDSRNIRGIILTHTDSPAIQYLMDQRLLQE